MLTNISVAYYESPNRQLKYILEMLHLKRNQYYISDVNSAIATR